jgi:hypothetical protein
MTEWLMLIVLVSAVVVPLVVLFGFAGCSFEVGPPMPPPPSPPDPPDQVVATATSTSTIEVSWQYPETLDAEFEVLRLEVQNTEEHRIPRSTARRVEDSGLREATLYVYVVTAFVDNLASDPSAVPAEATTFGSALEPEPELIEERTHANRTLVQRFEAERVSRGGSRVRIYLQHPSDEDLLIQNVSISHAATSGNLYDSAEMPIRVTGETTLSRDVANGIMQLPDVPFDLDPMRPLLIAFDIGTEGQVRRTARIAGSNATAFVGPAVEALTAVRSGGEAYISRPDRVYIIHRIEVA